ncbi:MAG: protein kinase [Planctomycetes bacterium]|nr:protein kinase [Planctomycetota bacterium]
MPPVRPCPEPPSLAAHARSELTGIEASGLDQHLAACRSCLDHYLELGRRSIAPEIPGCHVVKEIGRGRFGVVYKAWWLAGEPRLVGLKILSSAGEMERSRFDREIAVLKRIDSPSIVKCLDAGTTADACYYVMDYVEGLHLDQFLATSGNDLIQKLRLFQQVCRAVADAHACGVVHRDLKPRNILVDAAGRPHVLDFGICSVDSDDWSSSARSTITQLGDVVGTLKYMSPEQAWGGVAGPVDQRTDVWALGIMLYEIVTGGGYPYSLSATAERPAHEALLERIRKELPRLPRLDALPRGRDLEILIERCLTWEREERLDSAAALADDLDRYCRGERTHTRPLSFRYRVKRVAVGVAARSRGASYAAVVAAILLFLWGAALVLRFGWQVNGREYAAPHGAASANVESAADDILIAGVFDESTERIVAYARENEIAEVNESPTSWRLVHARLLERLAPHRPRVVVWDYFFRTQQPDDTRFSAAIAALEDAGVPVVLAAAGYDENAVPDLSPSIRSALGRRLRHGAIVAREMVDHPGEFAVAFRRGEAVVPSLALTTLAAGLHAEARLEIEWPATQRWFDLLYEVQPGAFRRERDRIELTSVTHGVPSDVRLSDSDLVGWMRMPLDSPQGWSARTVAYEKLLTCAEEELRGLVSAKIVLFGDLRTARRGVPVDRHPVRYAGDVVQDVPGCFLIGDAIAGLLNQRFLRSAIPPPPMTYLALLAVSLLGCFAPRWLASSPRLESRSARWGLGTALGASAATCFALAAISRNAVAVHAGLLGFCLSAALGASFWVEFIRNRHRMLDRSRRAVETFALVMNPAETVTSVPR